MRLGLGMGAVLLAAATSVVCAEEKKAAAPVPAVPAAAPATAATPAPAAAPAVADASATDRITVAELKKLMDENKVLVVDVRSADAYKAGHIAGSVLAPLGEIEKHLETLKSAKKPIVTYCS